MMIRYINPLVAKYATGFYIVQLGSDDFGLYVISRSGVRNNFGTPLAARGTLDEVMAYREQIQWA